MASQRHPPARGRVQSETLESSLIRLITDHQTTFLKLREQTDKYKKEAVKSAYKVSDLLVEAVNGGVEECYVNEKRIEVEIRALKSTVTRFGKNIDQWLVSTHAINSAVKVLPFLILIG
ncbi:biogenesis of lysosome-related organelles complex 1 subunit 1 [Tanacetum coccineum]